MNPILYASHIGTLAAWLCVSTASTVGICVHAEKRLPALKSYEEPEIQVTEGEFMDVDLFAGGSASAQELDVENNEEMLFAAEESVSEEVPEPVTEIPEVPALPESVEVAPLPEVPLMPVPRPKQEVAKVNRPLEPKAKPATKPRTGTSGPVARRTETGAGTGSGSGSNRGAGAGDVGAARFSGGRMPKPAYPPAARKQGVEGTVRVSITVDESGTVVSSRIVSASHPLLNDSSILRTVNRWKFKPGPRATRTAPIRFVLH